MRLVGRSERETLTGNFPRRALQHHPHDHAGLFPMRHEFSSHRGNHRLEPQTCPPPLPPLMKGRSFSRESRRIILPSSRPLHTSSSSSSHLERDKPSSSLVPSPSAGHPSGEGGKSLLTMPACISRRCVYGSQTSPRRGRVLLAQRSDWTGITSRTMPRCPVILPQSGLFSSRNVLLGIGQKAGTKSRPVPPLCW